MSSADKLTNAELVEALEARLRVASKLSASELREEIEDRPTLLSELVTEHCDCSDEVGEALEDAELSAPDTLVERFEGLMDNSLPAERDDLMRRINAIALRLGCRVA